MRVQVEGLSYSFPFHKRKWCRVSVFWNCVTVFYFRYSSDKHPPSHKHCTCSFCFFVRCSWTCAGILFPQSSTHCPVLSSWLRSVQLLDFSSKSPPGELYRTPPRTLPVAPSGRVSWFAVLYLCIGLCLSSTRFPEGRRHISFFSHYCISET